MTKTFVRACLKRVGLAPIGGQRHVDTSLMEDERAALHAHSIVSTTTADGTLVECNTLFERTLGYQREELIGQPVSKLYAETDYDLFRTVHKTLTRGDSWSGEQRLRHKDGKTIWVRATIYPLFDANGTHVKSLSIRTDITESKKMQSEKDMYSALHMMQDEIYLLSTQDLSYVYMNAAAKRRFGWSGADFMDQTLITAHPDLDLAAFRRAVSPLLEGDVTEVRYAENLDGETFETTVQLMRTTDGLERFACLRHNISQRVALEKAKDEFTATVSHELRSPLTSIKGGIGLVLSGATGELSEKARNLLEIAHRNSERLVLIVNDMLEIDKIAAGKMVFDMGNHDAAKLLSEALTTNEAYLSQYGVTVKTEGFDASHYVQCDPDRMAQVLNNLLSNAAKFSHPGGEVHAAIETTEKGVEITVKDFGVGIPKAAQATIFDRFTQAQNGRIERRGTGLGLSIVKAIVESHNGDVHLHSEEGKGATFSVFLPHGKGQRTRNLQRAS